MDGYERIKGKFLNIDVLKYVYEGEIRALTYKRVSFNLIDGVV